MLALSITLATAPVQAGEGWPRSIKHANGTVTLQKPPQRVVSTSPSLTGTLLAIDAPIVATAAAATGPMTNEKGFFRQWADVAEARGVKVLYSELTFDIEALIVANPDLVIVSRTGGDSILPFVAEIEALGFPVMVLDYALNSWETLATTLGRATGREAQAAKRSKEFTQAAQEAGARTQIPDHPVSIISYNFFGTYGVSKPISAQARVLQAMGFEVIGTPQSMAGAIKASREFDFLSHENLPAAIKGDTLFLLAGHPQDIEKVKSDPVLGNLPAVKSGRVFTLGPSSFRVDFYSGIEIIKSVSEQLAK